MIFKVQLAIVQSSQGPRRALIYDEDRTVQWEGEASEVVIRKMNGSVKAFFHGRVKDGKIALETRAPWQDW